MAARSNDISALTIVSSFIERAPEQRGRSGNLLAKLLNQLGRGDQGHLFPAEREFGTRAR